MYVYQTSLGTLECFGFSTLDYFSFETRHVVFIIFDTYTTALFRSILTNESYGIFIENRRNSLG